MIRALLYIKAPCNLEPVRPILAVLGQERGRLKEKDEDRGGERGKCYSVEARSFSRVQPLHRGSLRPLPGFSTFD